MERSWHFLNDKFPWATFLSEGAFKRVYRVWNSTVNAEEAVSVMDVDTIEDMGNKEIVGAELSVSVLLSSLVRRNVCPNFVVTRGVFTCPYEPASSHWGCAENKKPMGSSYDPNRALREGLPVIPSDEERGKFQYIRMELCRHGDMEEWLKTQPGQSIAANEARMLFFQMSFALHAAADRYSMKHYDVKLLNFFLQSADDANTNGNGGATDGTRHPYTVLRYGIGSSVFGLRMSTSRALIAKLADYGTANIRPESNGQPVTIGQFTTLENSPPEFMISGDAAKQGYGHDSFGLGLCMLHLFTGDAPYEEILENVTCPVALKRKLKNIWENQSSNGYDVIRCVILADVYEDEDGNVEGEPDEVLYDTLYRYLVLFGIPDKKSQYKEGARVWRAITSCLIGQAPKSTAAAPVPARRSTRRNAARTTAATSDVPATLAGPDAAQYEIDTSLFSLRTGTDPRIAEARQKLEAMDGGMELLLSLVSFDPSTRATPLDAINSNFFAPLREEDGTDMYGPSDQIKSFMAMGYAS
jgi:serine/threonine protein kinase